MEGSRESAAVRVGGGENVGDRGVREAIWNGDEAERKHLRRTFPTRRGCERTRACSSPERSKGTCGLRREFETGARVRDGFI